MQPITDRHASCSLAVTLPTMPFHLYALVARPMSTFCPHFRHKARIVAPLPVIYPFKIKKIIDYILRNPNVIMGEKTSIAYAIFHISLYSAFL